MPPPNSGRFKAPRKIRILESNARYLLTGNVKPRRKHGATTIESKVTTRLVQLFEDYQFAPGFQVSIDCAGERVAAFAWGRQATGHTLEVDSLMPAFCLTKPVFALMAAEVMQASGCSLDLVVSSVFPEFKPRVLPAWLERSQITVRQLLDHMPGIPQPGAAEINLAPIAQRAQLVANAPLPANGSAYGDFLGWWILEQTLEECFGVSPSELLLQSVLVPLGLGDDIVMTRQQMCDPSLRSRAAVLAGGSDLQYPMLSEVLEDRLYSIGPSFSGYVSANGLCDFYRRACFENRLAVSARPEFLNVRGPTYDQTFRRSVSFAQGFMYDLSLVIDERIAPRSLGHVAGYFPSFAFC